MSGTYLAVEGIDGAGKSTLIERLTEEFPDAVFTAEPKDDMWTGKAVREAMIQDTSAVTDTLLFAADRAEHLNRMVRPALDDGALVISDRGHLSTYAYQRPRLEEELDVDSAEVGFWLDELFRPWNVEPDASIWLDTSVDVAIDRMSGEEKWANREHLEDVRWRYEDLYTRNPGSVRFVDGDQGVNAVVEDAVEVIEGVMRNG